MRALTPKINCKKNVIGKGQRRKIAALFFEKILDFFAVHHYLCIKLKTMTTRNYFDGAFNDNTYTITLHNHCGVYRNSVTIDPNVRTMPRRKGLSTKKQRKQRAKAKRARKIH